MVRALLAGTKTQTRRVVKYAAPDLVDTDGWPLRDLSECGAGEVRSGCPYGQPGDRLWVREAWRTEPALNPCPPREIAMVGTPVQYEAGPNADVLGGKLRPGMFMPRWASRITLEITDVRVERLQQISEADTIAEGAEPVLVPPDGGSWPHYEGYRELWERINGAGSWGNNPWVWCLSFRRVDAG